MNTGTGPLRLARHRTRVRHQRLRQQLLPGQHRECASVVALADHGRECPTETLVCRCQTVDILGSFTGPACVSAAYPTSDSQPGTCPRTAAKGLVLSIAPAPGPARRRLQSSPVVVAGSTFNIDVTLINPFSVATIVGTVITMTPSAPLSLTTAAFVNPPPSTNFNVGLVGGNLVIANTAPISIGPGTNR